MYLSHYGLAEPPFRITPVTDFFYGGANRAAILEALVYAITHGEGIIKVVGEVGTGKTMMCRVLLERLPQNVDSVYLADPSLSREEILYAIADELGVDLAGQRATVALRALQDALIQRFGAGRRVVLLVDEAHAMPLQTLEEVRLLSNLETTRNKLLQIVLFGQPELDDNLRLPQMRQLKDRIVHNFGMQPMEEPAIRDYLDFRMRAAGYKGPSVFNPGAVRLIARASQGLTRRVNILADKSLLAAFVENAHGVEPRHVRKAVRDSEFELPRRRLPVAYALGAAALLVLAAAGAAWQLATRTQTPGPQAATPAAAPVAASPAPQAEARSAEPPPAPASAAPDPDLPAPTPLEAAPALAMPANPAAATGQYKLLEERLEATRALFGSVSPERFTVHLFYTQDHGPDRIEAFLQRASKSVDSSLVFVLTSRGAGKTKYRVFYGSYPSRDEATAAMTSLPAEFHKDFRLQLTTLEQVRRAG